MILFEEGPSISCEIPNTTGDKNQSRRMVVVELSVQVEGRVRIFVRSKNDGNKGQGRHFWFRPFPSNYYILLVSKILTFFYFLAYNTVETEVIWFVEWVGKTLPLSFFCFMLYYTRDIVNRKPHIVWWCFRSPNFTTCKMTKSTQRPDPTESIPTYQILPERLHTAQTVRLTRPSRTPPGRAETRCTRQ